MGIEVEVLYTDRSRVTKPIGQAEDLVQSGILALVVRDNTMTGKQKNITAAWGFDNYALCHRIMNGQSWVAIYKWDDGDFVWRRTTNHLDVDARLPVDLPLGCWHMVFRGEAISDANWAIALDILNNAIL